ncbi:MAG: AAA family ATPase [Elusimicrobiota bacterium]
MRLHSILIESFGALTQGEWDLAGGSAVFLGKNEAGKTTFADALLCALYGPPGGRELNDKRFFTERYGEPKTWGKLEAVLDVDGKKGVKSKPSSPQAKEFADKELFRRLLVLRAGECLVEAPEDSGFLPAFSQKILGGGKVDLQAALKELEAVHSEHGNRPWQKAAAGLEKRLLELRSKLEQAGEVESAGKKAQESNQKVLAQRAKIEAIKEKLLSLQAAEDRHNARLLRELKAKWEEACDRALKSRPSGSTPIQEIREKSEAVKRLEAEHAMAGESLRTKEAEKRRRERQVEEAGLESSKLPDRERRMRLRDALQVLEKAQAAAGRSPGTSPTARLVFASLAGVAGAAVGYAALPGLWLALPCFVIVFALGWWLGNKLMSRSSEDPESVEKACIDYEYAAEALGWKALALAEVKKKLEESSQQESAVLALQENARKEAQEAVAAVSRLADEVSSKDKALQEAMRSRNAALATWGAATTHDVEERENLAKAALQAKQERLSELRRSLGEPGLAEDAVGERVRLRVGELEAGKDPSAEHAKLSEKAVLAERRNLANSCRDEEKRLERLLDESHTAEKILNHGKGAVGDPAKLHAEMLDAERRLRNLKLWREAAAEAHRVIMELAGDLEYRVKNLVAEAGPLFKRLSGGKYGEVALTGESVFKKDSLTVTHCSLGQKPAAWMSSGAADLLWLSLRITLAKRAFPEGGVMVLDEPFLTLDVERTRGAVAALLGDSELKAWQFLILTKDERTAELAKAAGAKLFEMG